MNNRNILMHSTNTLNINKADTQPPKQSILSMKKQDSQKEQERQIEVNKIIEKEQNEEIAKNKVKYLKINHKLLDKFINDDFPVEIESIRDYDTIIKLCLLLQEEATVINKGQNINIDVVKDYNDLFDEDLMEKILDEEEHTEQREDIPE